MSRRRSRSAGPPAPARAVAGSGRASSASSSAGGSGAPLAAGATRGGATNAAGAAGALFAASAASRAITFSLNFALLRLPGVSADVLGFASSDMELLTSSLLFNSREAARLAALRAPPAAAEEATAKPPDDEAGGVVARSSTVASPRGGSRARGERARSVGNVDAGVAGVAAGDAAEAGATTNALSAAERLRNLAWAPVLPGLLFTGAAAAALFLRRDAYAASASTALPGERAAALLYVAAAAVELLCEPLYILSTAALRVRARAGAEVAAAATRAVATFALAAAGAPGAVAFGGGALAGACALAVGLLNASRGLRLLPSPPPLFASAAHSRGGHHPRRSLSRALALWPAAAVGPATARLLLAFSAQGVLKHALTELDRVVLSALAARGDRGAYAVAANYGGLAARLLFFPLEEATRALTSRLVGARGAAPVAARDDGPADDGHRGFGGGSSVRRTRDAMAAGGSAVAGSAAEGHAAEDRAAASSDGESRAATLARPALPAPSPPASLPPHRGVHDGVAVAAAASLGVLRGVALVGATLALFGHAYAPTLVALALPRWAATPVPSVLAAYAVYVFAMGVNGVAEAFAGAAADAPRVARANAVLAAAAVGCTAAAAWALPRFGPAALVWVNVANSAARAASALLYTASLLAGRVDEAGEPLALAAALPHPATAAAWLAAAAAVHAARARLPKPPELLPPLARESVQFVAVGAVAGAALLATAAAFERAPLARAWARLRGGGAGAEAAVLARGGAGEGKDEDAGAGGGEGEGEGEGKGARGDEERRTVNAAPEREGEDASLGATRRGGSVSGRGGGARSRRSTSRRAAR